MYERTNLYIMVKIKYLMGILIGSFGLLYMLFASAAFAKDDEPQNAIITYGVGFTHLAVCLGLFASSYFEHKKTSKHKKEEVFEFFLNNKYGEIPLFQFAELAELTVEKAQQYLEEKSAEITSSTQINQLGELTYCFTKQQIEG